jgi:hypothetical protein
MILVRGFAADHQGRQTPGTNEVADWGVSMGLTKLIAQDDAHHSPGRNLLKTLRS